MVEAFISVLFGQLNHVIDAQAADEKQEEYVRNTVKEALLGCCIDWKTINELTVMGVLDAKLKRYAEMLNVVAVRFRASDMLSLPLCERIWGYAREIVVRSDKLNVCTP